MHTSGQAYPMAFQAGGPHAQDRALVLGCNTFPTWISYPGLFASLVNGNPVVVKPHPNAIPPLAITVAIAREVLVEVGFSLTWSPSRPSRRARAWPRPWLCTPRSP